MEHLSELASPNIIVGFLLVIIPRMARAYHLVVMDMESDDGQETIAFLATIIGVYGFILGTILIAQESVFWSLMVFNTFFMKWHCDKEQERLENMRD